MVMDGDGRLKSEWSGCVTIGDDAEDHYHDHDHDHGHVTVTETKRMIFRFVSVTVMSGIVNEESVSVLTRPDPPSVHHHPSSSNNRPSPFGTVLMHQIPVN